MTATAGRDGRSLIVERDASAADCLKDAVAPALLRRVYAGRGITDAGDLDYRLSGLPDFASLKGIDAAVDCLDQAIEDGYPVLVVGDFDADGATSTALALEVLTALGADVDFFMPQRAVHGYGLSPAVVDAVGGPRAPGGLLVTVDNGIAALAGVAAARDAGWRVVVTDHHLPGARLPDAQAIVNPNQPGCGFVGKSLAGVGVVFYTMAALRARRAARGAQRLPNLGASLDLVAVGTVADVVPLDRINRTLVSQGLRRIRAGRARPGIAALAVVAGRDPARLTADDIGFAIGPRLNAAGRLEDMGLGVSCLRAVDAHDARAAAETLSSINHTRRGVQARMQAQAEAALPRLDPGAASLDALVVYEPDWHEGVVGLIAARLRERIHRPVVAFAPGEDGMLKGSARSIPGVHVRDVLAAVDAESPGLITRFGGHAQAAGLTLDPARLGAFKSRLEAAVTARLTDALRTHEWMTDGELAPEEHSLAAARMLREAGPWGAGFEPPLFHGIYQVLSQRVVGHGHLKAMVQPAAAGGEAVTAMWFNRAEPLDEALWYRLVFRLEVNAFRGEENLNLIVMDAQPDEPGRVRRALPCATR